MFDFPHASVVYPYPATQSIVVEEPFNPALSWVPILTKASDRTAFALAETQIEELSRMEKNWDGYGGLPVSRAAKYNALDILRGILLTAPTPDITPNPNGTMSFEWESSRGVAHLEVGQTRLSFYINPVVGDPIFIDEATSNILFISISVGFLVSSNLFPDQHGTTSVTKINLAADVSSAY